MMFPPLDTLIEYWIEYATFGRLYVMFTFPTRMLTGQFQALQLIVPAVFGAMD